MVTVSIKKEFNGFLLDVNFSSEAKVTTLFAPSGSGKTLTLQAIAGLINPDEGIIRIKDKVFFDSKRDVNLPPQKRKVGYLFQDYALFPHLTVLENVRFGSRDENLVAKLLQILEIDTVKDKYPSEISGGQKQRVALARALATKPELLLLDEPFSALHKTLKLSLYEELRKIQEIFEIPIILVTHDIDEVFELADFMVVMDRGKVVQLGEPYNVFMNPKNKSVARLLGHKNFLRGRIKRVEKNFLLVEIERGYLLKCRKREDVNVGDKVLVSILPTSLALNPLTESTKVVALVKEIVVKREFTKLVVNMGEEVEFLIPSSLSPNFIIEEGRTAVFHLCANCIPVIKEEL